MNYKIKLRIIIYNKLKIIIRKYDSQIISIRLDIPVHWSIVC